MRLNRKTNSKTKRFCIFITQTEDTDGSTLTIQDEVGDVSLKVELKKMFLREVLEKECY